MTVKRIFIISGAFILLVGLLSLLTFSFKSKQGGSVIDQGEFSTYSFKQEKISINIPDDWDVFPSDSAIEGLTAAWEPAPTFYLALNLYLIEDEELQSLEDFRIDNPNYNVEEVKRSKIIEYQGIPRASELFEVEQGQEAIPSNGYVVGRYVKHKKGVVFAQCKVQGGGYTELVPYCEAIIQSLSVK